MRLTAIFESWHILDGNYPPLSVGDRVRLSFEVSLKSATPSAEDEPRFDVREDGDCEFVADVIRQYIEPKASPVAVLDAGTLRFYLHGASASSFSPGERVSGHGTLALDHYLWVEFLDRYPDPPDLFYNFEVTRILRIRIPERFVHRHARGKSLPTTVPSGEYSAADVEVLDTMEGQSFDEVFYLLDLDSKGLENEKIARTFQ